MNKVGCHAALGAIIITAVLVGCWGSKSESAGRGEEVTDPGGLTATALSRSGNSVIGRFTQMSPDQTGLTQGNVLRPENMRKYLLNGAGVATGDFDDDGLTDLFMVSQDGSNRLYRQTSPWKFKDVTNSSPGLDGGNRKGTGAAFVDVDNDGKLDLYVCNIDGPNQLFMNQGDGLFSEESKRRGVDFGGATTMASFADYDRDGDLDLYLVNNRILSVLEERPNVKLREKNGVKVVSPEFRDQIFILDGKPQEAGQRDRLFQNDGDGKFSDVTEDAGISGFDMGLSATWWDYDNDGWMDLYVANDLKSPDHLYRNQGDGTFSDVIAETVGHTPWFSMGADAADINNDGLVDFLVSDMSSTTHYKQKTTMGEMGNSAWFLTMGRPRQFMRNSLYLNSGAKRLFEAANLTGLDSTDWSWSIKFGDFDSDMLLDVFVTNGVGKNMNDSDSAEEYRSLVKAGQVKQASEQLLKMEPLNEENLVFRNRSDLSFENMAKQWGVNHLGVSQGACLADIDRDGDLDLIVNNMNEPLGVYRNDISNRNNLLVQLTGTRSNRFGINAKVTVVSGDTRMVRVMNSARGFMSADEPVLHFGLGENTTVDEIRIQWPSGHCQRFSNVAANQLVTITEGTQGGYQPEPPAPSASWMKDVSDSTEGIGSGLSSRHREFPYDDFADQPLLPNQLSQLGPGVAWADINGDGLADCYTGSAGGSVSQLRVQAEGGSFTAGQKFSGDRGYEDMGALFFDLEGDGDMDLYVVSGSYERPVDSEYLQDRLYLNDGSGHLQRADDLHPGLRSSGSCVVAADYDRDGDLDLFVGTRMIPGKWPLPASSHLLENQNGRLVEVTGVEPLENIGLVTSAVWSDVDRDGWIDLLVTLEWGPVKLLLNQQGKLVDATGQAGLSGQTGWWNSISAGDIDNDGDTDFVAGNFGLNTKYHADSKHPVVLFATDFDNNGTLDLVEAEFEGDVCYPIRGRSCSSQAMPFLKDKFPTYHEFALADLSSIYTDQSLKQSDRYQANQLESMVLVNDGKGQFEFRALPRLAQLAPGFGSVLQDFDGDGNLDLCLAQNFMVPQPETGQMDGGMGLMLQGDGSGKFKAMLPGRSGIQAPGQGMALTLVDLDGNAAPDLFMSINDRKSRVWLNQVDSGQSRASIDLQYVPENRQGIGSQVTTITKSGARRLYEVRAGHGYLSQSVPTLFVSVDQNDPIELLEVRWPDGSIQSFPYSAVTSPGSPIQIRIEKKGSTKR